MGKIERTIELDERLLEQVEAAGLTLEQAIRRGLDAAAEGTVEIVANHERQKRDPEGAERRARAWAEENAEAIKAYNERIELRGVFGDDLFTGF